MDGTRFDEIARAAAGVPRRTALRTFVAGAGLAILSWFGAPAAGSAQVEVDGTRCKRTGQRCKGKGSDTLCCSQRCKQNRCVCRGKGGRCIADTGCCSNRCRSNGRCK
jgi:hypothetical protein